MSAHILDTFHLGRPGIVGATLVESKEGLILFDTGPESTFANLSGQFRKIGFNVEDVRHVFLSHIHFDHAGAAWRFAELGATIYVHPRGAPHLADPKKLIDSATRIYGDEMEKLWGRFAPIAERSVRAMNDLEVVRVAPFEIRAIATPGHANHHNAYQWDDNVFGGDVVGVQMGGGPPVPPFVPPELHVESWLESIERIRGLKAKRLFLPHFGMIEGAISAHLDALAERIKGWARWFRGEIRAGQAQEQLIPAFRTYLAEELRMAGASNEEILDYEHADPSFMAVGAAWRYWQKYHPEEVVMGV